MFCIFLFAFVLKMLLLYYLLNVLRISTYDLPRFLLFRIILYFNRFHQSHRDRVCIRVDHRCHYCIARLERGQVCRSRELYFCY